MEEIKFETEFLNEYFRKETRKEKFALEDIRGLYVFIDGNNEKISQDDLDILMQLSNVYLSKIDLSGLKLKNANLKILSLSDCTITDCSIENCSITELDMVGCETDQNISLLKQVNNLKKLGIKGKITINADKIKQEYPGFNEMNLSEKRRIAMDPTNGILEEIDISSLYELPELEELDIERIKITNDQLKHFGKFTKLRRLAITETEIDPEIEIPKIETLKELIIERVKDLKTIKNLSEVEKLAIYQYGQRAENTEILKDFTMLETLKIDECENITGVLPNAIRLKDLKLNGCGISEISFLERYPDLDSVELDENNLTESALAD